MVFLRASPNPRPRCEFLKANAFVGPAGSSKLETQAYADTLASNSFIRNEYFQKLQHVYPEQVTWSPNGHYFNFSLAVGTTVHQAQVIKALLTIGTFQVQHTFGVAPIEDFECILGVDFCHQFLLQVNWQAQLMELRDPIGQTHQVQGDVTFIKSRKLDLIVPPSEIPDAVSTQGCLLLMVQPVDTTYELTSEEADTTAFKSKLSNSCNLTTEDLNRLQILLDKHQRCFEKRNGLPPERVPGESFKINLEPGTQPVHRNYYRLSPHQQEALRELLTEYVDSDKMDICPGSSGGPLYFLFQRRMEGGE